MKHEFLTPTRAQVAAADVRADDDIDVAIVKVMSSHKGHLAMNEIYDILRDKVDDPEAIKPTMFMLNNNGWFDSQMLHFTETPVYRLRAGKTVELLLSDSKRVTRVRKFKPPEAAIIDPAGRILVSDGVDVAIWKVMQDYKWRTLKAICALLKEFGFSTTTVDRRLVSLVRTPRWFDRQGSGPTTTYRLKSNFPCPIPADRKAEEPAQVMEQPQAIEPVAPVVEAPKPVTLPVLDGDTIYQAIWKVTADGEYYSLNEICVLLSDNGYSLSQVSPVVSKMFQNGFFTRITKTPEFGRSFFIYKATGKPMPTGPQFSLSATTSAPVEAPKQVTKEETMSDSQNSSLLKVVTDETKNDLPLLEIKIETKGIALSLEELGTLYGELRAQGFRDAKAAANTQEPKYLNAKFTIKDTQFTRAELLELVKRIEGAGETFRKALL